MVIKILTTLKVVLVRQSNKHNKMINVHVSLVDSYYQIPRGIYYLKWTFTNFCNY